MPGLSTPPGARRLTSLRTLPTSVDCALSIASPEHFWPRLRYSPLRLKTAAVFGSIDCSFRLHSASSTPPSLRYGGMALHSGCTRKLSLATTFRLSPTPLLRRGVGPPPFHRQPETSACYSGPSMPCRRSPSSGRRKPTISALLPPIEEDVIAIQSVGCLFIYRLRRWPQPQARCADALTTLRLSANHFTHSEFAYGLGQGQVGLLSAVQAPQQKACRSVPPRHLPFALILCRHSEFPPFLWLTHLRYAPHRHHRTSPSFIPSTCLYLRQGRTVLSQRSISTLRKFDLHGSDLTAQWGRSVGAFLHIPRGREGRGKNERQRGGGCAKPLRGQAPVTPNSLILRSFHLATRYKSEIFVERDPREMANLPVSQIFKT